MTDVKKDEKKSTKKSGPCKKSKIEVNPIVTGLANHSLIETIKTIFNANKAINYNLTENEENSLKLKSSKYNIPFNVLESIFKIVISENTQSNTFAYINSLINDKTINEFFVFESKATDTAVPGKTSKNLLMVPREGYGISRRLRNQIQSKIIDG